MPLILGDGRDLEEKPLAGLVAERGLAELDLDNIIRVTDDASDFRFAAGAHFAIETLEEVETASPELPSPAEVADAVSPVLFTSERREGIDRVSNEATSRVRVEGKEEGDEQVMSIPKRLKRLLANAGMRSRVHEHHTQQHNVTSNAACLGVVDLDGADGTNLSLFDIVKVDIVG